MDNLSLQGNIVDIFNRRIYPGELTIENGKISSITELPTSNLRLGSLIHPSTLNYLLPGFIDSHVHIESSMLVPSEFAKLAVVHGTVGTVSDPHEIANVCGMKGVEYMIQNGKTVPFKFHFGAPSCVPATGFETAGDALTVLEVDQLLQLNEVNYLSEMMNFPGVLNNDAEVMNKIALAKKYNKPVDGHAPGLRGPEAKQYIAAGISTDHECFTAEEALDKLQNGMKILVREGSAAKNFDALADLLHDHHAMMMFCSDDKHPDSLASGHINQLCARAVARGIDIFKVLDAACINPVLHYNMNVGLLREGDAADLIVVEDLIDFKVLQTYIDGRLVAENGLSKIKTIPAPVINNFACTEKNLADLAVKNNGQKEIPVIVAMDGQLITERINFSPLVVDEHIVSDIIRDILKIVVVNRYLDAPVAVAFVKNFGLKDGALASSVAHDSHNIVAVGTDDACLLRAINLIISTKGGISAVNENSEMLLALPVAGLMSNAEGYRVSADYTLIDQMAREGLGSGLSAPFMTLSFMALLVIPHIKLSDKGLFDGDRFAFIDPL